MAKFTETKRPAWVLSGEQWSGSETQEQYEKAGKKLASGVVSVLPSAPVAPVQRYGDPYQMYTNYRNAGGQKSMIDWESAGRPSGGIVSPTGQAEHIAGLDITAPTEGEQEQVREDTRKKFQTQIDAINEYFGTLISQEQARGAERLAMGLGKEKSMQARRGILDSPMGEALMTREGRGQQEYTAGNVKLLAAEQQLKKSAVLDKIDTRADATIQAQKDEAEANYEKAEAYKTSVRNEALSDYSTVAQTTPLDVFKANTEIYNQAKFETGFDTDLEFDSWYQEAEKVNAEKLDRTYKGENGNTWLERTIIYPNGKHITEKYDLGYAYTAEAEDPKIIGGVPYNMVRDESGKVIKYEKIQGVEEKEGAGTTIKSGGLEISASNVAKTQQELNASRGDDGYANSKTYLEMRQDWLDKEGLEADFYKEFPPKNYLNPNDASIPQYIKDKLKTSTTDGFDDL